MIPLAICPGDFLSLLELHIFPSLRYVNGRKVKLDYLFQRFGRLEGYDEHQHEFACTHGAWEHLRPRVVEEEDPEENPKEDPAEDPE
ncbi:hypothetical protein RDI58_003877 [Solanum bulbocastanum]|uniref:Uncharacterized protein n=1 Tax=Solanum bulbocastanum TaxID=147425 RepID=A0AAN8U4R6_SOLBU